MDVLTALKGMATLIHLDDKQQLIPEKVNKESNPYLWCNSNLAGLTSGGSYPELETLTSSHLVVGILSKLTAEWSKYKNTGELPMDSNLLKVLIGIRDFIELDNRKELAGDDMFIIEKTVFFKDGRTLDTINKYPELACLLEDMPALDAVEQAIKELKLLQLTGMLDDTDLKP